MLSLTELAKTCFEYALLLPDFGMMCLTTWRKELVRVSHRVKIHSNLTHV